MTFARGGAQLCTSPTCRAHCCGGSTVRRCIVKLSGATEVARRLPNWSELTLLPTGHKRLLITAWLCMPMFWVGARLLGARRLMRWMRLRCPPSSESRHFSESELKALGRVVNAAALYPPWPRACLPRSLLLLWLLRRRGVEAELRIGVRLLGDRLDAHAWVVWQNTPINDRADISDTYRSLGEGDMAAAFMSARGL